MALPILINILTISSLLKTLEGNFSKNIPKLEKNFLKLASIKLFFLFSKIVFKILKKAKNVFSDKIFLLIYSYLIFFAFEIEL